MRITLGIPLTIAEIARATGGTAPINENEIVHAISTDTRTLEEKDLFWAIKGASFDGADYISAALATGCHVLSARKSATIRVKDTTEALSSLASYYKRLLKNLQYTVAITGSVGKTTTKEFLKEILSVKYKVHATEGNYNNTIGMPLTILSAPFDTEILILEMGMNSIGEISKLSKCAEPNLGIITNIGTSHIGMLGSRERIAAAKLELLDGMTGGAVAVPYGEKLLENIKNKITFSIDRADADVCIEIEENGLISVRMKDHCINAVPFGIKGNHFLECLGAALAVSKETITECEAVKIGISRISNNNIRQKLINIGDFRILDDSYNASYESIISDFNLLSSMCGNEPKSILIGTVLELGAYSYDIHYKIGLAAASHGFRRLFFFGEFAEAMATGALDGGYDPDKIFVNSNPDAPDLTATEIIRGRVSGETILFKASNRVRLSRVVELIKKQLTEGENG